MRYHLTIFCAENAERGARSATRTMTFAKSTLSLLCSLLFSGSLSAAMLGEMTVRSVPGEPLDAILTIEDVDLSSTTSMVRVAPPGTYLREGVAWPEQVQDLKLKRDASADNNVTVRVVGSETLGTESFPLLIELNVGGNVTVRQYVLHAENGHFSVTADLPRRTVTAPAAAPETSAAPSVTMAAASDPKEVKALKRRLAKKGRYAPSVVRDYVALNGFDSTQPFNVIEDMTIWSIAKLYWPVFEGCTMEQLVVGFEEKNPGAFLRDDPSKLVIGSKLTAPTRAEVLAIDPVAAFRRVHGNDTAIPMPTQNLIDAQAMSLETAEKTARAQTEARERGLAPAEVAAAGRAAIEADRAERTEARELMGEEHPGTAPAAEPSEPAVTETKTQKPAAQTPAESASAETTEAATAESSAEATAQTTAEPAAETTAASETAAAEEPGAPAPEELPNPDDAADQSVTQDSLNRPADPAIAEAAAEQNAEAPAEEKPAEEVAPAAVEPAQDAAKTAEPAPAAESEKAAATEEKKDDSSGLSGGVIGVGLLILLLLLWLLRRKKSDGNEPEPKPEQTVTLSKDIPPSSPAQLKALERTVDEAVKNGTTAGAMGVGAAAFAEEKARDGQETAAEAAPEEPVAEAKTEEPAAQPWLEPDDEMPPVDEEERNRTSDKAVSDVVGDLTLELDEPEEKAPAPEPEAPELPPVATGEPVSHIRSEREVAQTAAIDGKLKLAQAFVGLGALKEARELLAEVREKGTAQQREHAKFLEERIGGEKA